MPEKVSLSNPLEATQLPPEAQFQTETVPLPSNGVVYPQNSTLFNATHTDIRAMTARDEDILTSPALLRSGRAISTLLRSCLLDKSVDPDDMLVGDRNAALIGIRVTGYGAEYRILVTCPECFENSKVEIDLSELPVKRIPEGVNPIAPGKNEFVYTLPVSGKVVHFKLFTGRDESEFNREAEAAKKAGLPEQPVTARLMKQIISIDGETDKGKLAQVIRNLPARDSREFRAYADKINPGIEMKSSFTCPKCEVTAKEVDVPIGTEFFWPSTEP
jgi:hypothetical protein